MTINRTFGAEYESYISHYLISIKASDDDIYDFLESWKLKVLFYCFKDLLNWQLLLLQQIRHTHVIVENKEGLIELQKQSFLYIYIYILKFWKFSDSIIRIQTLLDFLAWNLTGSRIAFAVIK